MDLSMLPKRKSSDKRNKNRKYGRNIKKCAAYRNRVGKPNGRGEPGNKRH